jgi:hypothetical protein
MFYGNLNKGSNKFVVFSGALDNSSKKVIPGFVLHGKIWNSQEATIF